MTKKKDTRPRSPAAVARWETVEGQRLHEGPEAHSPWQDWGPYLSERQWGTVREDYSTDGAAWDYFPHDHARSRAYRWGEDGLAGFSDREQRLCVCVALWNGRDPILKERLFGLTNSEGNHGEDVKELYYYLDALPSHSYCKMLYKYPHNEFPYASLVDTNRRRGSERDEVELLDTGIFDRDEYFDVFVEYAQRKPGHVCLLVTVHNRGPEPAELLIMPQVWFRNTWSWADGAVKPSIVSQGTGEVATERASLGRYNVYSEHPDEVIFCDNVTNVARVFGAAPSAHFVKDAFHRYLIDGESGAVNPQHHGTKVGFVHRMVVAPDAPSQVKVRLTRSALAAPFRGFDALFKRRRDEATEFYDALQSAQRSADARLVQRQALAGMIWTKQWYCYDVKKWLRGDSAQPPPPEERTTGRNSNWEHLNNADIVSMPDKWEYPWYAAWDLAFHCIPLSLVDTDFAKEQLVLLTREWYQHPNGQMPAYEWSFDDVNPPVHAWATWRVFTIDRAQRGDNGDLAFLERVFHKLMLNFTWWVNQKDPSGRNVFQGGFLGLDNIGLFDRSAPLPTGGHLSQADGTSWMAMYSLNLMRIALELARHNPVYEDIASKFFEHFLYIARAITDIGGTGLWDEQDEFYYDYLVLDGGSRIPLKVRSMVGLIPLFAVEIIEPELLDAVPNFQRRMNWVLKNRPGLSALVSRWSEPGVGERRLLSLLRGHRLKCLLQRMLDESEFLAPYGVRAMSAVYRDKPYVFDCIGRRMSVAYEPGESRSGLFGGNSNWRGPIWFPVNFLLVEALQRFHHYYGDDFRVECPTGSGNYATLGEIAADLTRRLSSIFACNGDGERPALRKHAKAAGDPHFKDLVLFYEYFHGDNGRGVGAAHQTGWTGLIAKLLQPPASAG